MASFSVVTNIASVNAQANLTSTSSSLNKSLTRLSSGLRINMSGDDAAGLAVANGFRSDGAILTQGSRNANDGISDLQIKDTALNNISTLLDRLSTLATQSASGQTSVTSRTTLNQEYADVLTEITREATVAKLDVASGFSVFLSNDGVNGVVGGTIGAATTTALAINATSIASDANAKLALTAIDAAINTLGSVQAQVGTLENRLTYAISLNDSQITNFKAAESRIRDANIAQESANMTKFNILNQSGIAALAQANNASSAILSLLR
jgi:flagellin